MARRFAWNNAAAWLAAACAAAAMAGEAPPIDSAGLLQEGRQSPVMPRGSAEALEYRRGKVAAIRALNLYPEDYAPSPDVFKMTGGEPWLKPAGFFIANPQLLIITTPPGMVSPITFWAPNENEPEEQQIRHSPGQTRIVYRDVSANHWMHWGWDPYVAAIEVRLWGFNARDAGYAYAMLDLPQSRNIDIAGSGDVARQPVRMKSFAHYGNNVSANNLSPADAAMRVRLQDYSEKTIIPVKLWREMPADNSAAGDYLHIIEVQPNPEAADYDGIVYEAEPFEIFMDILLGDPAWVGILFYVSPFVFLLLGYFIGRHKEAKHYRSIHRREKALAHIPVTTAWLEEEDGKEVDYARLVCGSTAVSVDYFKRLLAFLRYIAGGEVRAYSSLVDRARREAILRMKESCPECDVFINCRLQTAAPTPGWSKGTASVEVIAYATALRYRR